MRKSTRGGGKAGANQAGASTFKGTFGPPQLQNLKSIDTPQAAQNFVQMLRKL